MPTNWSAEHYDCLTQAERTADRRPSPGREVAIAFPVYFSHRKIEEFIGGSAPFSTDDVLVPRLIFVAHVIRAAGKKVTNWICENCGPITWFRATPRKQ